ncbi:MAG TPA: cytochrome c maturation protein CcmE [Nitrospiria bacterium]
MTRVFLIRWVVILILAGAIVGMAVQRYSREVQTIGPAQVMTSATPGPLRVLGMVEGGTLEKTEPFTGASFTLSQGDSRIPVVYRGEEPDNLRELKTIVVVGRWDVSNDAFISEEVDLIPNFGFVLAAYLALIPVGIFLFLMERKVSLLYNEIKESRIYESEAEEIE